MVLMLTLVIPSISQILIESGQEIPIYTKIVIAISDFVSGYFCIHRAVIIGLIVFYMQFSRIHQESDSLMNSSFHPCL